MKQNKNGFTLMEMLIVIAIIAVLIAVAIPVFASQLEKAREATDLANVRSAYAQVSTEALLGDSEATVTVNLKQKQADWQSVDPVNIGGIVHYKNQGDTENWKGVAAPNGTCVVSYKEDYGIILNWSGKADPSTPKYPFNTNETNFFSPLYDTEFWKSGSMKNKSNFEFDSGCQDSKYVPSITAEINKLLYKTISYHDYKEDFYHAFLTGILAGSGCAVKSNREHGEGRSDIVIYHPDRPQVILFEAKYAKTLGGLQKSCAEALQQIEDRQYAKEFEDDYDSVLCYGIAFYKKRCLVQIK